MGIERASSTLSYFSVVSIVCKPEKLVHSSNIPSVVSCQVEKYEKKVENICVTKGWPIFISKLRLNCSMVSLSSQQNFIVNVQDLYSGKTPLT